MKRALVVGPLAAAACVLAGPTSAAVVNVNCATQNLQAQIDAANPGDTLRVKGTCEGSFTVDKDLTLDGTPSATLDAVELGRTLTINGSPTVRLLDLTITGGRVDGTNVSGGGIRHAAGSLTIRRVSVVGNLVVATSGSLGAVAGGGGISSHAGSLAIYDSTIRGNEVRATASIDTTAFAGGIGRVGALIIDGSTVADNRSLSESDDGYAAASGGGIDLGGRLTMTASRLSGNRATARAGDQPATAHGGGLRLAGAHPYSIRGSAVSGNRATAISVSSATAQAGGLLVAGDGSIVGSRLVANESRAYSSSAGGQALGGSLSSHSGTLELRRAAVLDSVAEALASPAVAEGGGIYTNNTALSLVGARVAANATRADGDDGMAFGGGISAASGAVNLNTSTVDRNVALASIASGTQAHGGGVRAGGALIVIRSTVSRNRSSGFEYGSGGGIALTGSGTSTLANSTVAGNRVQGNLARGGGLVSNLNYALELRNATVTRNSAKEGGGIQIAGTINSVRATILSGNNAASAPNCSGGTLVSQGYNLVGSMTGCTFAPQGSDRVGLSAKLGPLAANGGPTQTILPLRGSPARNWIPQAQCGAAKDQRGVARPQGPKCEIGSVEVRPGRRP